MEGLDLLPGVDALHRVDTDISVAAASDDQLMFCHTNTVDYIISSLITLYTSVSNTVDQLGDKSTSSQVVDTKSSSTLRRGRDRGTSDVLGGDIEIGDDRKTRESISEERRTRP